MVDPVSRRPRRPDEDTLKLALAVAEEALTSPALDTSYGDVRFAVNLQLTPTPTTTALSIGEPERRPLRDLLVVLRKFDSPTHDAHIGRVYEIIGRLGVKPDWQEGLAQAKAAFENRNEIGVYQVQELDEAPTDNPTWIRPRKAFELWIDGEVIHDDYVKEQLWSRMDPLRQGLVRKMAHEYMFDMLMQANFVARVIRFGLAEPMDGLPAT